MTVTEDVLERVRKDMEAVNKEIDMVEQGQRRMALYRFFHLV